MIKWDTIFAEGTKFTPLNEVYLGRLLETIEKQTGKTPKDIIDLGCGDGGALIQFARRGFKVTGIDFSEVGLAKAKEALEGAGISGVELRLVNLDEMEIQDKADIIFCKLTYAFVEDKEKFLQAVKNLMREQSVFVLITPVLHKGVEYLKEDKPGIAVDYEETHQLLKKHFARVDVFHSNYFGERNEATTFLCFL